MTLRGGVTEHVYLGGYQISAPLGSYAETPEDTHDEQRTAAAKLTTARGVLYTGCPLVPVKYSWELSWTAVESADLEALLSLRALGTYLDFCAWRPLSEGWSSGTSGLAQRRNALDVIAAELLPPTAATRFPPYVLEDGTASDVTFGAPDPEYRSEWTGENEGTAPVVLIYYPVYRVYVSAFAVNVNASNIETHTLRLREL